MVKTGNWDSFRRDGLTVAEEDIRTHSPVSKLIARQESLARQAARHELISRQPGIEEKASDGLLKAYPDMISNFL